MVSLANQEESKIAGCIGSSAHPWNLRSCQVQISRFCTPQSLDCVQVCTVRPRPDVSIFVWKHKSFFSVFQKLNRFCPSRRVRFRLKAQKLFPFLILWHHRFQKLKSRFQDSTRKHENSAFTGEIFSSEKCHYCITLRYFDQGCLSLVTISLHSFTDGRSSKVATEWRKCQNPQSRN